MNQFTRLTSVDLPTLLANLHRNAVGFDHMFTSLNDQFRSQVADNKYPPYNITRVGDANYQIDVAVAGWKESELDVSLENNVLTISGTCVSELPEGVEHLHRGISYRDFARTFNLAEHAVVAGAKYENGLLSVFINIEVPEAMKPRKIAITAPKLDALPKE